ncbi:MAG TPA: tRNA-uridine aminocarboxypropyltransferase [Smithella sp.]|nr:tRNA-uridine aminocarboxypropyltransferase [Smithella sp.]
MRSNKPRDENSHCPRCYQRREICICPILPTVQTRTQILILRHIYEAERPSNTGRFVALAMPNSRIIACGGGSRIGLSPVDDQELRAPGTWLLWPDGTGANSDASDLTPPARVVVIDATWQQARRLYRNMPVLWELPRLTLPAPKGRRERLREQRRSDGMSTLEAVAAAVAGLEGAEAARPLEELYDELVRRSISLRWGIKHSERDSK